MSSERALREAIIALIAEITCEKDIGEACDLDLFEVGLLDSLAAIELLVGIEERFDVVIAPTAVERTEMNTVNRIIAQIERRLP
jgi:D-alanine--poly(phosphoribitol) ligase subunit 2